MKSISRKLKKERFIYITITAVALERNEGSHFNEDQHFSSRVLKSENFGGKFKFQFCKPNHS